MTDSPDLRHPKKIPLVICGTIAAVAITRRIRDLEEST